MCRTTNGSGSAAMDGSVALRLASAAYRNANKNFGRTLMKGRADRIDAARRSASVRAAERAEHCLRLRAQSGKAAAQHVFWRGVGRRAQFQAATQLLEFDANGNFIGEMGKNLCARSF